VTTAAHWKSHAIMEAAEFHAPVPEHFDGSNHNQLPLFLYQVKFRFAVDAIEEKLPEEEKVFQAIGFLRGRAFACFENYLGDFLSNREGHRKKETDGIFGSFQVFENRLRLLFGNPRLYRRKRTREPPVLEFLRLSNDIANLRRRLRHAKRRQQRLRNDLNVHASTHG
jgi:hypothetical protein